MNDRPLSNLAKPEELLTRAQVAALLNVAPSTVTRWADEGRLTYTRTLGGHRRYPKRAIVKIIACDSDYDDSDYNDSVCDEPNHRAFLEVTMETMQIDIPNLFGDHHTIAVQQALAPMGGIEQVWASPARRQIKVEYDPAQVDAGAIVHVLDRAGYPASNGPASKDDRGKDPAWAKLNLRTTQTVRSG